MASDQDLAMLTEAEAIARAEAMRVAYERAADLAGQALRAYVVADLDLLAVRRIQRTRAGAVVVHHAGRQLAGLMIGDREVIYDGS